jgi:2-polyprenyl-3-methyl-5-hydroxy-6-metoxy-1,4-benzoquinol methylase
MDPNSNYRERKRHGDTVAIDGGYHYRALTEGPAVQRYWHALKLRYIECFCLPEPADVVVDIGCGSGVIADFLAQHASHVTGIDANERAIEFARNTFTRPNLVWLNRPAEEIEFDRGSVDKVYCMELIEHIREDQADKLLLTCHRMLRPSGRLFLTTPNYRGLWPVVEFTMDKLRLAPQMAGEQHVAHYSRKRLKQTLEKAGFIVRTLRSFSTFAPFFAFWPSVAKRLDTFELRHDLPFGNILLAVAEKQA